MLTTQHLSRLKDIFEIVHADFAVKLQEFNGVSGHRHLRVSRLPKVRLSELVNSLKGVPTQRLKPEFPDMLLFWSVRKGRDLLWTPSNFAGPVGGAPLSVLKQYSESQGRG